MATTCCDGPMCASCICPSATDLLLLIYRCQVELQQQTPQRLYLRITPLTNSPPAARAAGDSADQPSQPHHHHHHHQQQQQQQQQERWRVPEQLLPR
jgi:hypothetical protein